MNKNLFFSFLQTKKSCEFQYHKIFVSNKVYLVHKNIHLIRNWFLESNYLFDSSNQFHFQCSRSCECLSYSKIVSMILKNFFFSNSKKSVFLSLLSLFWMMNKNSMKPAIGDIQRCRRTFTWLHWFLRVHIRSVGFKSWDIRRAFWFCGNIAGWINRWHVSLMSYIVPPTPSQAIWDLPSNIFINFDDLIQLVI